MESSGHVVRRRVIALLFGLGLTLGIQGAELPVYTLEDCLAIGLRRAGSLHIARQERQIAETTIGQIASQVRPQLSAAAAYSRLDELQEIDFGDQSVELGSLDNYAASISFRQLLYSGGSVRSALEAARHYRDLESHRLDRARATLIRDIRAGFADLLLLEAVVEVHDRNLAQLRETLAQTERRFEQDDVAEFDVLNARVQLRNAEPDRMRAVNDLRLAKTAFRDLVYLEDEDFTVRGDLHLTSVEADLEALLDLARRQRPELSVMHKQIALREAEIRVEQGAYLPSLHLSAGYHGENPANAFDGTAGWEWHWRAGLQLSWNWLDGGLRRHTVQQKRLRRQQAVESREIARRAVELDVRQAWLRARHAAEALSVSLENIALAEKSLEIATARHASGLTTRLEMSEVSLALSRARLNHVRSLRDHHHAHNDLMFAVGAYAEDAGPAPMGDP